MNDQRPARQQHASTNRTAPGGAHPIPTVEWDLAARIGSGLLPAGPDLPAERIRQTVEGLRQAAAKAEPIIAEATGLSAPPAAEPYVVDRPTLVRWNIDLAAGLLAPYRQRASVVRRLSGAANAVQVAALFAWVGRQVLGQFDPFADPPRLLLVAPNVAEVGQQAQADPAAFRLWVCLHEVTHRYQFGHAPWLADHLYQLLAEVWQEETSLRSWLFGDTRSGLLGMFSPRGQDLLARGIAVMSLLGRADPRDPGDPGSFSAPPGGERPERPVATGVRSRPEVRPVPRRGRLLPPGGRPGRSSGTEPSLRRRRAAAVIG